MNTIVAPTDIFETNTFQFSLFPNPASNSLIIKTSNTEKKYLNIYDVSGRQVLNHEFSTIEANMDIENISSGIYFVEIIYEKGASTKQKLVVYK